MGGYRKVLGDIGRDGGIYEGMGGYMKGLGGYRKGWGDIGRDGWIYEGIGRI